MRRLLTFAGLVLLGSVVGCHHTDNCCGSNTCGGGCSTGCSSGCGGCGSHHGPCTLGVCDCDIPPLGPYSYPKTFGTPPVAPVPANHAPVAVAPAPAPLPAPSAVTSPAPVEPPATATQESPKAKQETPDK